MPTNSHRSDDEKLPARPPECGMKREPMSEALDPQHPQLSADEIDRRLKERPDLLERLNRGDTSAMVELVEVGTGAHVRSAEVRLLA